MKYFLIYTLFFIWFSSFYCYTQCDDKILVYCDKDEICCNSQKPLFYCCPNDTTCSDDGLYCIDKNKNFLLDNKNNAKNAVKL